MARASPGRLHLRGEHLGFDDSFDRAYQDQRLLGEHGNGGILGHGGARTFYRDFAGAPQANTWYPIALCNALTGVDQNGTTEEIVIAYNNQFTSWYFGTDGACPGTQIDFVQVILHEMCQSPLFYRVRLDP